MNKCLIFLAVPVFTAFSCTKDKAPTIQECYRDYTGMDIVTDTGLIFPFGTRNFWIYDDSMKRTEDTGIKLLNSNFLITPRQLYVIENQFNSITFNQWLPQMTLMNDTFYFTKFSETPGRDCFEHIPFLFATDTFTFLNGEKTKSLTPQNGVINTKMGSLSYTFIYEETGGLKYYINPKIGIIRMEVRNETEVTRSFTLNNYHIE